MLKKITQYTARIIEDILLVAGIAFLYYGVSAIHKPAGHITLGICFIIIAYLMAKRKTQ